MSKMKEFEKQTTNCFPIREAGISSFKIAVLSIISANKCN